MFAVCAISVVQRVMHGHVSLLLPEVSSRNLSTSSSCTHIRGFACTAVTLNVCGACHLHHVIVYSLAQLQPCVTHVSTVPPSGHSSGLFSRPSPFPLACSDTSNKQVAFFFSALI